MSSPPYETETSEGLRLLTLRTAQIAAGHPIHFFLCLERAEQILIQHFARHYANFARHTHTKSPYKCCGTKDVFFPVVLPLCDCLDGH